MVVLLIHCEALCVNCREGRVSYDAGDFKPLSAEDSWQIVIGNRVRAIALQPSKKTAVCFIAFGSMVAAIRFFFHAAGYSFGTRWIDTFRGLKPDLAMSAIAKRLI